MDLNPSAPAQVWVDASARRDPDLALAAVFAASGARRNFWLWQSLLYSLFDALWTVSNEELAAARLAWWASQFQSMAAGLPAQHPLLVALAPTATQVQAAHWAGLAEAVLQLAERRPGLSLTARAVQWQPLGRAAAAIGRRLAGGTEQVTFDSAQAVLSWYWQSRSLWQIPHCASLRDWWLPLDLLARHGCGREALGAQHWSPAVLALVADLAGSIAKPLGEDASLAELAPDRAAAARVGIEILALRALSRDPARLKAPERRPAGLLRLHAAWTAARRALSTGARAEKMPQTPA